jgi:hypothetical protein
MDESKSGLCVANDGKSLVIIIITGGASLHESLESGV